jgi:hypothetical protein
MSVVLKQLTDFAGTFGVVTSIAEKAFPQTPISSGSVSFSTIPTRNQPTTGLSTETFWAAMKAYWVSKLQGTKLYLRQC